MKAMKLHPENREIQHYGLEIVGMVPTRDTANVKTILDPDCLYLDVIMAAMKRFIGDWEFWFQGIQKMKLVYFNTKNTITNALPV